MILHLGVIDLPYANVPAEKGRSRSKVASGTQTTGDVATWLENKYHAMEHFAELHGPDIAAAIENALAGNLETLLSGQPIASIVAGADSAIEEAFRKFITSKELDALGYPGIPTRAAVEGLSHRFKNRKGSPRPSFVDTGAYVNSFKAWVD